MKQKVLLVDDDAELTRLVEVWLERNGYETIVASDGLSGLRHLYEARPDLVILDVMMPRVDGWEMCRRIREVCDVPIVMLTAKVETADRVRGFDLGADDYITKPFDFPELLARVKAILRRTPAGGSKDKGIDYHNGDLQVDFDTYKVYSRGEWVRLSPTEFRLLAYLIRNNGQVVTRRQILTNVWGSDYVEEADYVKVYVRYLREKIEDDPRNPRFIITERGLGYRFVKGQQAPYVAQFFNSAAGAR